jgi:uncharacterized protein (DUF2336 family)
MPTPDSILTDLEHAINSGSSERRLETLRRVTDLFLVDADRLNEAQIAVFDDVLCHLTKRIETKAMAELSTRLAPVDNAPIETIRELARHDEIAVAGPVLSRSARLSTTDLVDIAGSKGQEHLLAISNRRELDEAVTDVLVERGDREVKHSLARNNGARFSETGFTALVRSSVSDERLALKIGQRLDLPIRLLQDLLAKATEAVRTRLLANAAPEKRAEIQRTLAKIALDVGQEVAAPRDFARAMEKVAAMHEQGMLNEQTLAGFAAARQHEEVVAALSVLCSAPIDLVAPLMRSTRNDGLLVACKAAGLKWPTVHAILEGRTINRGIFDPEFKDAKKDFVQLSQASAQRTMRFWKVRTGGSSPSLAGRSPG